MEHSSPDQTPEINSKIEREPQPHDVAFAAREVLKTLVPDADPQDIEEGLAVVEAGTDSEEAQGNAAALFAQLGADYDEGLSALGEILQTRYLPNGDIHRQ